MTESTDHAVDQWYKLKALVLDAVTSTHSRRAYRLALEGFLTWWETEGRPPFTKATVQAFRVKLEGDGLAGATINVRLCAIRKLAVEAADNGLLDPDLKQHHPMLLIFETGGNIEDRFDYVGKSSSSCGGIVEPINGCLRFTP